MEPEQTSSEELNKTQSGVWNTVTPFSKYLAMALFIVLPFLGGWVGYTFAPEKIVESDSAQTTEGRDKQENFLDIKEETPNAQALVSSKEYIGSVEENRKVSVEMPYQVVLMPDKQLNVIDAREEASDGVVLLNSPLPVLISETFVKNGKLYFSTAMNASQYNNNKMGMAGTNSLISHVHSYHLSERYIETYHYDNENYFWPIETVTNTDGLIEYRKFYDDTSRPIIAFTMTNCIACHPSISFGLLNTETYELHEIGYPVQFEWIDETTYRYKDYPSGDDPQAEFVHTDRESGIPCGIGGCPMTNIDWNLVPWQEGSI